MNNITIKRNILKKIDRELEKITDISNLKQDEINKQNYEKYYYLFELAFKVLRKHKVLLYGGTAINEILPKRYKIYGEYELPDIDVYCTKLDKIVKDMKTIFKKQKLETLYLKEALHKNTFKLYVEGLQLIDFSVVSEDVFKKLLKCSQNTSIGISTVNINYLKYSLHAMLSQPLDSHRWTKIFNRLVYMYLSYPIKLNCNININNYFIDIPDSVNNSIKKWISSKEYKEFGWNIIKTYIVNDKNFKKSVKKDFDISNNLKPIRYILAEDISVKSINDLIKNVNDKLFKIDHVYDGNELMSDYICMSYNGIKIMYIFTARSCVSYINYNNCNILSIHSLLKQLYEIFLNTNNNDIQCIIQLLHYTLINNAFSKEELYDQFIINCYGKQKGFVTLRRDRFYNKFSKKIAEV